MANYLEKKKKPKATTTESNKYTRTNTLVYITEAAMRILVCLSYTTRIILARLEILKW